MLKFLQYSFTTSALIALVVIFIIYFRQLPNREYSYAKHRESAVLQVWSNDTEEGEEEGLQLFDSTELKKNGSTSTAVAPCVPNHSFLMQTMTSKIGLYTKEQTAMKIIAAFDYSNYSAVTTEVVGWYGKAIYCRYLDLNRQELGDAIPSTVFPESVVYCCSREGAVHMTLTEKADDPINQVVRITDRRKDDPRYFLSLCLSPIYGKERKWLMLAELFEHYKLQGVEHFYVYIKEMDKYTKKLVDYYVTAGEAEVVTFVSQDIENVIATQVVGFTGEKTLREHLPMAVFHNSSAVPPRRIIQKCVLDPKHILIHFVHQVRAYYPGYEGYDVPFEDAHIRHYREDSYDKKMNYMMERIVRYGPFEMTEYPNDHVMELRRNVKVKLEIIYNVKLFV